MRYLTILFTILLFTTGTEEILGQEKGSVMYELNYSRSDFSVMQKSAVNKGITAKDLAGWIVKNGSLTAKSKSMAAEMPTEGMLTIFLTDENGSVVRQENMSVRLTKGRSMLTSLLNTSALARIMERMFPDSVFFPDSFFFPDSVFYPDSVFNSSREAERPVTEISRRAGNQGGKYNIVLMISPGGPDFELPVNPGYVLFNGNFR